MRIFITGASGFIGGALARTLASEHEILAMSRSDKSDLAVKELGAEPVRCDLATLEPGDIPDCDAVVHCAAYVESWGTRELTWKINVEETRRTLEATRSAGAREPRPPISTIWSTAHDSCSNKDEREKSIS